MKLFYRKYGEGPPLIILHGLLGSSDNWATIAKNLSDRFTVYLPDQRNHGLSPHSDVNTYESMRDDLHELALDLKLKKFFLAGHSMGGKTAVAFALNWPEMLYGLLIADISPFADESNNKTAYTYHMSILETMRSMDFTKILKRDDAVEFLNTRITDEKTRGLILKNLQRNPGGNFSWKINVTSLLNNLGKIMKGINRDAGISHQITGFPVTFLKGKDSNYLLPADYKEILHIFPVAEFIEVEKAGHWINADRPDEVAKYLRRLY